MQHLKTPKDDYDCSCYDGYYEVPGSGGSFGTCEIKDCQSAGLEKNSATGWCDDIDECTVPTHDCDPQAKRYNFSFVIQYLIY